MDFSVIIATFDRGESLQRLLSGVGQNFAKSAITHEVIVANNAREAENIKGIDSIVEAFRRDHGDRFRSVREPDAGKCRAQNRAIAAANGKILAFFDDDVEVTPEWLEIAAEFFRTNNFDAMQGPILMPSAVQNDEAFLRAHHRYRTINFVQYPPATRAIKTLTGANMAIRRELFDRIGLFNENLGPGRSGISEDVEFARRIIDNRGTIGYEHRAGVYHEVDWNRLTEEFFRQRHEQQGRSRLIFKHQTLASVAPNVVRSILTFGWYSLIRNERKKYRAKGRYFHYRAMLQEIMKSSSGSQV
jgi:glycosyltransferase involved in cell wall biosynthesis